MSPRSSGELFRMLNWAPSRAGREPVYPKAVGIQRRRNSSLLAVGP